ncbi:glycosyltransferase family 4 protein [Metabacillus niabensis]|uniref:glycosyltransferase family 4 protein n=1 Tax=Metabacillus niabensis TaxID=324854 RepID=UPI001CFA4568|nr:glycosyltransferase family 4 protein [Metabacillus niabensis]
MRVLHYGFGGQMITMCESLKKIGVNSKSYHMMSSTQKFKADVCFEQKELTKAQLNRILTDASKEFDVFHFHFGRTFMFDRSDLPLLKAQGKKLIVQHRGSDVRRISVARNFNNPYVQIKKGFSDENKRISILKQLSASIDHAIVADHELKPYIEGFYKKIHVVPQAIHLDHFLPKYPSLHQEKPLIIHSPTHYKVKGTKHVLAAIDRLQKEGHRFRFRLLTNLSHEEALKLYRTADIVIDQLLIGSFGVFSLEAMALGKPVICYLRDDLIEKYPQELPIVNANPDTLYLNLKSLLVDAKKRHHLGQQGRNYAEAHHDSGIIAKKLKQIYQQI